MTTAGIAVRLASLHENPGFSAIRFDDGPALEGRVAVLPSAFNPPTLAHSGLLELALAEPDISHVGALLSTTNVDKQLFGAPLAHRIGMLLAFASSRPWLAVLATNAARLTDQGLALKVAFPEAEFDFVVGYDTLVRVFDERYYTDMNSELNAFFLTHRLIATNRAQSTAAAVTEYCSRMPAKRFSQKILVRELPADRAWMSSSAARGNIGQGGASPALAPEVERYIHEHGIYGAS